MLTWSQVELWDSYLVIWQYNPNHPHHLLIQWCQNCDLHILWWSGGGQSRRSSLGNNCIQPGPTTAKYCSCPHFPELQDSAKEGVRISAALPIPPFLGTNLPIPSFLTPRFTPSLPLFCPPATSPNSPIIVPAPVSGAYSNACAGRHRHSQHGSWQCANSAHCQRMFCSRIGPCVLSMPPFSLLKIALVFL